MVWNQIDEKQLFEGEIAERSVVMIVAPIQSKKYYHRLHPFKYNINLADFEQHGVVETSRYGCHSNGHQYLIIQFKDAASASNLIRKGSVDMYGLHSIVKPLHYSNDELLKTIQRLDLTKPAYQIPAAPRNAVENILNVLNDDCLGEIFKRINRSCDAYAIENVCKRFKQIAGKAFDSELTRKNVDFSHIKSHGRVTLTDIEKFLHSFGSSIVSVTLLDEKFRHLRNSDAINPIFKLVHKYCPNLKSLSFRNEPYMKVLTQQTLIEIRPLLSKLSHSAFRVISLDKYSDFISSCTEIESLTVYVDLDICTSVLPQINFPKLKYLKILSPVSLGGFLANNIQIEELDILKLDNASFASESLPNIKKLTLRWTNGVNFTGHDSVHLRSLNEANISLQIELLDDQIENVFEIKNITSLHLLFPLNFADYNMLIEMTRNLWNLKNLYLDYHLCNMPILSKDVLMEMLQHANKLTNLDIAWRATCLGHFTYHFHEEDFSEILQVVKGRTDPLKLYIDFFLTLYRSTDDGDNGEHKIKTIPLNMHSQWLTITTRYENIPLISSLNDFSKDPISILPRNFSQFRHLWNFGVWFNVINLSVPVCMLRELFVGCHRLFTS